MPMAVRTMRLRCVLLQDRGGAWHALLRSQSAHRNEAAQQAGCCQQGPMLPHARIVQRGPAYTGFSDMRLFELEAICENYLARCRRSALKKQQRESEEEDAEAAIAEHEEDRSPAAQAKKIWARAPYIACHGRLSRCKRLPLILDRVSTPAWLATLRPVKPRGSELRLLPNTSAARRRFPRPPRRVHMLDLESLDGRRVRARSNGKKHHKI
jgi:hypothetical protein